jgi:hypothetical protein
MNQIIITQIVNGWIVVTNQYNNKTDKIDTVTTYCKDMVSVFAVLKEAWPAEDRFKLV